MLRENLYRESKIRSLWIVQTLSDKHREGVIIPKFYLANFGDEMIL